MRIVLPKQQKTHDDVDVDDYCCSHGDQHYGFFFYSSKFSNIIKEKKDFSLELRLYIVFY